MMKRFFALFFCLILFVSSLSACARMSSVENSAEVTSYELRFQGADGQPIASDDFESIKKVLEARLKAIGFINIIIELIDEEIIKVQAQAEDNDVKIPDDIGSRGQVTFQEVDEASRNDDGSYRQTGKIILDQNEVTSAEVTKDKVSGQDNLLLHLSAEGSEKFEKATERLVGRYIAIFIDDKFLSAPRVAAPIKSTEVVISGSNLENIDIVAAIINSGSMPFDLAPEGFDTESAVNEQTQAEPTLDTTQPEAYPMFDVSRIMFDTGFKDIASNPKYENYKFDANIEHTLSLTSGESQKVLYTYNDNEISISINGNKTIIDAIPKELWYDKVEIVLNEFEGDEWLEVHYLFRVAPDGICVGTVSDSTTYSGYVEPYNEAVNYDIDDYLNLLGNKEEVITKELGNCGDIAEDFYNPDIHRYLYDRMRIYAYKGEIIALNVSGHKMFGRAWGTFTKDQVHYSQIEDFFNSNLDITSVKTKYFENVLDETLEYIKYEYKDYVLYFRLWGDHQDEVGHMLIIRKDFDGTLEDALLAMLG